MFNFILSLNSDLAASLLFELNTFFNLVKSIEGFSI